MPSVAFRAVRRVLLAMLVAASPAAAAGDFAKCLATLQHKARQQGVSSAVVRDVLGTASFNDKVVALDRRQPEFTQTFAGYLDRRVTDLKVKQGRALLAKHRKLLDRITRKYGVPAQYLLAFWGLETHYGRYFGDLKVIDSLATLACDRRRDTYFRGQLMAALHILDEGAVTPRRLTGSWAGAMGNFQFMPSVYLRYTVDFDGDGRRDLWNSLPDAMASAANFLDGLGWQTGTRWGREVRLPRGFPYQLAGLDRARPLKRWRRLGVTEADGARLPDVDIDAALLLPAGHRGPAFLVYHNFRVIMRWNHSVFYALSVGYLADRIDGAGTLRRPPPADEPRLSRETVRNLQRRLNDKGFDSGTPDGIMGPGTRDAIRAYQQRHGMIADGHPGSRLLQILGLAASGPH